MEVLALVVARGGSKGIPGKNIHPFLGRPLIDWSIRSAKNAKMVTRVVTSTDSTDIATAARAAGSETPFMRPAELAQDDTLDLPVFQHALRWLEKNEGYRPDLVVHLRPTSPLRPPNLIDDGIQLLSRNGEADSVRSVCVPDNNPYKMWTIENERMVPLIQTGIHEQYNQPHQLLPKAYWQIGALDVIRTPVILKKNSMSGDVILPLIMDAAHAVDINDPHSLLYAESLARSYGLGESA